MKTHSGKAELPFGGSPFEGFANKVEAEDQAEFSEEYTRNGWMTLLMVALALAAGAIWGVLFWQAESVRMQLLWGLLLLGEMLGVGIIVLIHLLTEHRLILQQEHHRLEIQMRDCQERLGALQQSLGEESKGL